MAERERDRKRRLPIVGARNPNFSGANREPVYFLAGSSGFFFLFFFFLVYNLADRPKKCAKITPFSSGICLFFPVSLFPEELGSRDNSARSKVAFLF